MATANDFIAEPILAYMRTVSLREPPLLAELRAETAALPKGFMQVAPEVGQFLGLLVELIGARRALELGTFTGYSALCIARALGPGGRLVACDVNEEALAVARRYWARAGLAERIELRVGEVRDALAALAEAEAPESFDFAFIDADKPGYPEYYEACLRLVRPGGLIVADNVLYGGTAAEPAPRRKYAEAIRRFNALLTGDERVSLSMVPLGDGLTLARKRG